MDTGYHDEWTDYAKRLIRRHAPKARKVIDLACGTGETCILLAKKGFKVSGLDLSSKMVNRARRKAKRAGVKAEFIKGDLLAFDLEDEFDAATCFCNTINYFLDDEALSRAFKNVFQALRPGGAFIFDANSPKAVERIKRQGVFFQEFDSLTSIWRDEVYHDFWQINLTLFQKQKHGLYKKIDCRLLHRAYPQKKIVALLGQAGFRKIKAFDNASFKKAKPGTARVFYLAVK
jgi:ubiquinone/menaquinone biosynthesis C-methylase UbiE